MFTSCEFLDDTKIAGGRQQQRSLRDVHALAQPTHSAELWEFDPLSRVWTEIVVNSDVPSAREGHTASVAGSKMVIFGGRGMNSTAGRGSTLLSEQWEIDLDASRTVVVQTNTSTVRPAVLGSVDSPSTSELCYCTAGMEAQYVAPTVHFLR